ncbi:MAG: flagellar filament outer layer protein FlaA [Treponemataceae bacterium]|nr:flagellar filament outer layer protein FlaA [Treponemataceae bacterium]
MKQSGRVCLCLMLVLFFCLPVFAQPSDKSVETILIDDFDRQDEMDWTWSVLASKYVHVGDVESDQYPKYGFVEGIPNSLRAYRDPEDETEPLVFGVQVWYDRKGDNWMEIFPADKETGELHEIVLSGNVTQIDFWVWGANYLYSLDMIVRDCNGSVHVLPATVLSFNGWKNIVVQIPTWLKQQSRLRSIQDNMKFLGFRITADPNEYANDFAVYFDRIRYTTNTLNTIYDGYDLRNAGFESQGR